MGLRSSTFTENWETYKFPKMSASFSCHISLIRVICTIWAEKGVSLQSYCCKSLSGHFGKNEGPFGLQFLPDVIEWWVNNRGKISNETLLLVWLGDESWKQSMCSCSIVHACRSLRWNDFCHEIPGDRGFDTLFKLVCLDSMVVMFTILDEVHQGNSYLIGVAAFKTTWWVLVFNKVSTLLSRSERWFSPLTSSWYCSGTRGFCFVHSCTDA